MIFPIYTKKKTKKGVGQNEWVYITILSTIYFCKALFFTLFCFLLKSVFTGFKFSPFHTAVEYFPLLLLAKMLVIFRYLLLLYGFQQTRGSKLGNVCVHALRQCRLMSTLVLPTENWKSVIMSFPEYFSVNFYGF